MMNAQQSALDGRGKGGFTFSEVDVRSLTTIAPTTEILANGLWTLSKKKINKNILENAWRKSKKGRSRSDRESPDLIMIYLK